MGEPTQYDLRLGMRGMMTGCHEHLNRSITTAHKYNDLGYTDSLVTEVDLQVYLVMYGNGGTIQ